MWGWGHHGFGMGWMALLELAVLGLLVYVLVRAVGRPTPPPAAPREDRALGILRERYARGEIDRETFERIRVDLEQPATPQ